MTDLSTDVKVAGGRAQLTHPIGSLAAPASNTLVFALVASAAFVLYWG